MPEKIIALRISMEGDKETVQAAKAIDNAIRGIGVRIDALDKKLKTLRSLEQSAKKLEAGSSTSSGGTGTATTGRRAAHPSLRKQILEAKEAGEEYSKLVTEAARLKQQQTETNREIREQARLFEEAGAAAGSYRQINAELVRLRNSYRQLGQEERDGLAGRDTLNRIRTLDRELKSLDADIGIYARNVGNYANAFSRIGGTVTRFLAVGGIALGADEIVREVASISDSISNVEKVTGLATAQARALAETLKLRDTRTSLDDLLAIAEIGGRVGINTDNLGVDEATRQLVAFTDAIDTANVALGDQFNNDAEQVASTLAGLRNVLTTFRPNGDADIGGDLLRIGNALNFLETQGNSTAPVIADFVGRIGGIAVPFGASTESIFALSATLDELEVSAERGATAVSNTLGKLAAAPQEFAEVVVQAGLIESTDQFVELVNEDIVTALTLVSQAVAEGSKSNTDFSQTLQALGITGARAQEVFAKLGGNADRYTELLGKSTEALSETTSLTEEFSKKNDNLAGDLDKVRKNLTEAFATGEVQDALRVIVQAVGEFLGLLLSLPAFIKNNRFELLLFVAALATFNAGLIATRLNTLRLAAAQKIAVVQQRLLNIALRANPIGLVVTAVLLLVAAFSALYRNSETVRNGVNSFVKSMVNAYDNSVLLKIALGPVGLAFRFLFDVLQNGKGAVDRYVDAIKTFASNVPPLIEIVKLKFKQFALAIEETFSFGAADTAVKKKLDDVANQIETERRKIEGNNEAFRQREIAREKDKLAAEAAARREAAEGETAVVRETEKEKTDAEKDGIADRLKANEEANKERERADKEAEEAAKRRREQEAKDRLAAAAKILDLENDLIQNRFDRQEAQARTAADREIAGLVGDPEQVREQTRLVLEALRNQLQDINQERRRAHAEALADVRKFADDLERAQIEAGEDEAQAALNRSRRFYKLQAEAAKNQVAQAEVRNLEAYRRGELTLQEFTDRRLELERNANDELQQLTEERVLREGELDAQLTQALLVQAEQRLAIRRREILAERGARDATIEEDFAAGDIDLNEFGTGLADSERIANEERLAAEREFQEKKFNISQDFAERNLERIEDANEAEVASARQTTTELIRLQEQKNSVIAGALANLGQLTSDFLTDSTRDFKDYLKQVLLLSLRAVKQILLVTYAQITAQDIATKGFAGVATTAAKIVLIEAAFGLAEAAVQSFKTGGVINGQGDGLGNVWEGGQVPMHAGFTRGRSHATGGIKQGGVELEGGEYVLRNGPERLVVNGRSARAFEPVLRELSKNPDIFSPFRRQQVSAINAANGWGRKFAAGGVIGATPVPLAAPLNENGLVPFLSGPSSTDPAIRDMTDTMAEMIRSNAAMIAAVNSRVDRLRVYNDPAEVVRYGQDKIRTESRGEL